MTPQSPFRDRTGRVNVRVLAVVMGLISAALSLSSGIETAIVSGVLVACLVLVYGALRDRVQGERGRPLLGERAAERFDVVWAFVALAAALVFGIVLATQRGFSDAGFAVAPVFVIVALWLVISTAARAKRR